MKVDKTHTDRYSSKLSAWTISRYSYFSLRAMVSLVIIKVIFSILGQYLDKIVSNLICA